MLVFNTHTRACPEDQLLHRPSFGYNARDRGDAEMRYQEMKRSYAVADVDATNSKCGRRKSDNYQTSDEARDGQDAND